MAGRSSSTPAPRRRRPSHSAPASLAVTGELRPWQDEALAAWRSSGHRGIVAAATGTGKTFVALAAISELHDARSRTVVVVPSVALQAQWVDAMISTFGLSRSQIGTVGGGRGDLLESHALIVAVINSARDGLSSLIAGWHAEGRRTLVVVDECHWAGAAANRRIFDEPADAYLGLSATPERSDDGLDDVITPQLGDIVYRYSLLQALDDGLLAPLRCIDLYFDLGLSDQSAFDELEAKFELVLSELGSRVPSLLNVPMLQRNAIIQRMAAFDSGARAALNLLRARSALLANTSSRRPLLNEVFSSGLLAGRRTIVFHERISEADQSYRELSALGHRAVIDSSSADERERRLALRDFRSGAADVLVAVRTIDEGVDVPAADLAVISAGSLTIRQRIQRIGRVVRPKGSEALVISLLARASSEETEVGAEDQFLVGRQRVLHHRWPQTTPVDAVRLTSSTYSLRTLT